ncbi:MAG: toll/interleukin-1 receptor domain-containing protein [Anaerolineae bacterium]|nr:toll/interleukin-1 receptor domain-containing protein [Anaerolineae bacterium]
MNTQRWFLMSLAALVVVALSVWLVVELVARPGEVPLGPLVGLGIVALLGLFARLRMPSAPRRNVETAYRQPETPDDIPDWLADATAPPDEPKPTLDVSPPRFEEELEEEPLPPQDEPAIDPDDFDQDFESASDLEDYFAGEGAPPDAGDFEPTRDIPRMVEDEPEATPERDVPPDRGVPPEPAAPAAEDDLLPDSAPIQFAAYYPPEVKPDDWQPLRAYIYKEPAYDSVLADARAQLGALDDIRETVAAALQPVPDDALVTAIPSVPGLEFDPPQASARFRKDWRRFDFEFCAVDALLEASADGQITFFVEGVIVADVKLSVYVSRRAGRRLKPPQESTARPYQAVFCSYSHKDTPIVVRVERSSRMHFTKFLRDVTTLRSGERWNDRLLELIDEADIFQLFWSKPASESPYVAQEWQYALALRETGAKGRYFIRPVRWEEPMAAPPPPELADLHFDLIRELVEDEGSG